jgi:hypothetical protein
MGTININEKQGPFFKISGGVPRLRVSLHLIQHGLSKLQYADDPVILFKIQAAIFYTRNPFFTILRVCQK